MLLVIAGNLFQLVSAWVATSLFLHRLLLFYPDRVAARRAARKKFITARLGDVALLGACGLARCGLRNDRHCENPRCCPRRRRRMAGVGAAGLLALAAALKSAQFPTHGWLTEVMETPTPVSALLHAGVINAGGFLLIRFADVLLLAPGVLAALVILGGFTALFGSLVMLTQPAVKTSLAWSTVAQMGFMIFECGLAFFRWRCCTSSRIRSTKHIRFSRPAARSSGSPRSAGRDRSPFPRSARSQGLPVALAIYVLVGLGFGLLHKSPQAIALGAILVFGVAYMLAQGFADAAPAALTGGRPPTPSQPRSAISRCRRRRP